MSKNDGLYTLTVPASMVWTDTLFAAKAFKNPQTGVEGAPKFGATFLLATGSPDHEAMRAKCVEVAKAKWPGKALGTYEEGGKTYIKVQTPFKDGTQQADAKKTADKDKMSYARGKTLLAPSAKYRPGLGAIVNGKIVDMDTDAKIEANKPQFYSGVQAFAEVNFVAYEQSNGDVVSRGVTCYLNSVLSTGKGEKIGGGARNASEVFKSHVGQHSAVDPLAGAKQAEEVF